MLKPEQLAAAALEELRKDSPQRRERIFDALCVRYPSRVSKAEVKTALQLLERRGAVVQVHPDVWAEASRGTAAMSAAPLPLPRMGERFVGLDHSPVRVATPSSARGAVPAPSAPLASLTADLIWSTEQKTVIEAPKSDWLLVEAGPGTGKTAVACARVAHLLNSGVPGHAIVMVSFTRTAVTELRERIRRLSREARGAASVRITTLDSEAWHLGVGFGTALKEERLRAGYSANIRDAASKLRDGDDALLEWLSDTQHLIVDEGQDLVGDRAELIFCLLDRLAEGTGVTIFVDPAQAIYGFSSDVDDEESGKTDAPFHEQLVSQFDFRRLTLTKLFRTGSRVLKDVFASGRSIAVGKGAADQRLTELHALVERNCEARGRPDEHLPTDDELVLFRRRSEVLLASSFLSKKGAPHRLRLSQVELGIQPWVGAVLATVTSLRISEAAFSSAWSALKHLEVMRATHPNEAWALLLRAARAPSTDEVDVRALRRVLSTGRPPPEFCLTEAGVRGPILGTVHASKGRESIRVRLMLPERRGADTDLEEEVRVDYVGATRARELMTVGQGYAAYGLTGLNGPGGRLQRVADKKKRSAMVEIGRPDDLEATSPVSRSFQTSSAAAQKVQENLLRYDGTVRELRALQREARPWPYLLCDASGEITWGALTQRVNQDFLALRLKFPDGERLKPPEDIRHLHLFGVRTVVLAEGDARLAGLHEPWATHGVFFAPVIKALTTVYFRFKSRSRGAA